MKKKIFIAGCARSGTTAFTRLLNSHPRIIVCTEQFGKEFKAKDSSFNESLFERENIIQNSAANIYKFKNAVYIGDKLPSYYLDYDKIFNTFPHAVCIFLIRNIFDVAQSFKVRKLKDSQIEEENEVKLSHNDKVKKDWTKGVRMAVNDWNLSLENTLAALEKNQNVHPIIYEKVFSRKVDFLDQYLNMSSHKYFEEYYTQSILIAKKLAISRPSILDNKEKFWIMNNARFDLYMKLTEKLA